MPGGDRTGPLGMGPRTGRVAGYCAGYEVPGYLNPAPGWGAGFGPGRRARGGTGRRGGWGGGWGWRTYPPTEAAGPAGPQTADPGSPERRLEQLEAEISEIRRLVGEVGSSKPEGE